MADAKFRLAALQHGAWRQIECSDDAHALVARGKAHHNSTGEAVQIRRCCNENFMWGTGLPQFGWP